MLKSLHSLEPLTRYITKSRKGDIVDICVDETWSLTIGVRNENAVTAFSRSLSSMSFIELPETSKYVIRDNFQPSRTDLVKCGMRIRLLGQFARSLRHVADVLLCSDFLRKGV